MVRIFSAEHRKKLSDARRRRVTSDETRRKLSLAGKGRKHTMETKLKISESNTGKVRTSEMRSRMSEIKKGCKSWNKGLTKETSEGVAKGARNSRLARERVGLKNLQLPKGARGYGIKETTVNGKRVIFSHYIYCKNNSIDTVPKGFDIHHIDGDHANNKISNLQKIEHHAHTRLHAKLDIIKLGGTNGTNRNHNPRDTT